MKSQKKNNNFARLIKFIQRNLIVILIFTFFFSGYLTLSSVKHLHFLSGYDLSIIDQAIWKYAHFKNPITTAHVYFDTAIYRDHLELIFLLIAPLYRLFDTVFVLIFLQVLSVSASGIAVYLIARKYKLKKFVSCALLASYYLFFGIQFAIWSDVHSLLFAVGFLAWYLYFLETKKDKLALLFLFLSIICKEDIALLTLLITLTHLIFNRRKILLLFLTISILYLLAVFFVYFPAIGGYKYATPNGVLHDTNPIYFIDTPDKQKAILFSLASFGFLPLLSPLYLIPFIGDLGHYFVLGNTIVKSAQGLFAHYRSSVALFLIWPTIITISRFRKFDNKAVGSYILISALFFQYYLHLPLSYLSKSWFWNTPPEVSNINSVLKLLPKNASVVTQNNIASHIAHRDEVYTLFPYPRDFKTDSPCNNKTCKWFRVGGNPKYLLIDMGGTWNILHYLASRDEFFEAIGNLERNQNIKLVNQTGTTKLYKIVKKI